MKKIKIKMEKTIKVPDSWVYDDSDENAPSYLVDTDTGRRVGVDLAFIEWQENVEKKYWNGQNIDVSIDDPDGCYLDEWSGYKAMKLDDKIVQADSSGRLPKTSRRELEDFLKNA